MAPPSTFHLLVVLTAMCGSALWCSADGAKITDKSITMAKLNRELRREPEDFFSYHVFSMFVVAGLGARFYNITDEQISAECLKTARVAVAMKLQLTLGKEMESAMNTAVADSMADLKKDKEPKHPLELVCQRLEKAFAEKPTLSEAREKASKNVSPASSSEGGRAAAYSQQLFTRRAAVAMFMMRKLTVPDLARYICDEEVQNQLDASTAYSVRTRLLVEAIVSVAHKQRAQGGGESIQRIYEKSLDEIAPRISANVSLDSLLLPDEKTFWFLPELLKIFYRNLADDAVLKKQVDDAAAVFGKDADKADLDFSKI